MSGVDIAASGIRRPLWTPRLARFCAKVLGAIGAADWEVSILLCDDDTITALNRRYRRKDSPTDVLSFRQGDTRSPGRAETVGDVAISLETTRRNARAYGVSVDEELKRIATHGLLHLAGMDHGSGKGEAMIKLQERILDDLRGESILGAARHR
jgi:probable rRNA maturation factor